MQQDEELTKHDVGNCLLCISFFHFFVHVRTLVPTVTQKELSDLSFYNCCPEDIMKSNEGAESNDLLVRVTCIYYHI